MPCQCKLSFTVFLYITVQFEAFTPGGYSNQEREQGLIGRTIGRKSFDAMCK